MDIQQLIRDAHSNKELEPVYLMVGTERFLIDRAVETVRRSVMGAERDAFNEEVLFGKSTTAQRIVEAAKTLPMMSSMRFILVRGMDALPESSLDPLSTYLESPAPSTSLILLADKLDGRTRLAKSAKKSGFWVDATPLKSNQLRGFCVNEAKQQGHKLDGTAAGALVDALGNDLSAISDALERLSLFVGENKPIDADAVSACVSRIRVESIWKLVDAVGMKDKAAAMQAASSLLDNREPPLRILAMVTRQLRMVARIRHELASGQSPQEAARAAGAPPFKAKDLTMAAKQFRNKELAAAFRILADTDIALKSSKRPPESILQGAIVELTQSDLN